MERALNKQIAQKLQEAAELLEQQGANPFRVRAYRNAAETVSKLDQDLEQIVREEDWEGLTALPAIGKGIATSIHEMITTGRWSQLERLRGALEPVQLFQTLPGIGPDLAERIYDTLQIDSLEALEAAAYDGRLRSVEGIGERRLAALRAELEAILGRLRRGRRRPSDGPSVALLLDVDREYREKAEANKLPKIAPRRFNPEGKAWLPVLHTSREDWHFTALYSNTARAHQLDKTRDWVVVYFYDDHHQEGQYTVVTETQGTLEGKRVVRGRESECRAHYRTLTTA